MVIASARGTKQVHRATLEVFTKDVSLLWAFRSLCHLNGPQQRIWGPWCHFPCGQGITTHPSSQGGEGVWSRSPCSLYQVFIFVRATRLTSRCVLKFLKQLGGKPWAASIAAAWIPFPDLCLFSLMRLCYWYSIVPTKTSRNFSAGIWPYSSLQEKWTFFIWHLNLKPTHDWLQCLTDRASQPPVPFLYPSWAHGNDKTDVGGCSLFIWFMKQAVQHWAKGVVVLLHFCGFRIQNIFYQQFSISTEHLSHWSMWLVLVTCSWDGRLCSPKHSLWSTKGEKNLRRYHLCNYVHKNVSHFCTVHTNSLQSVLNSVISKQNMINVQNNPIDEFCLLDCFTRSKAIIAVIE